MSFLFPLLFLYLTNLNSERISLTSYLDFLKRRHQRCNDSTLSRTLSSGRVPDYKGPSEALALDFLVGGGGNHKGSHVNLFHMKCNFWFWFGLVGFQEDLLVYQSYVKGGL